MLSKMAANSILTKTRAKYGKSLTEQNYRDMAALGSVSDVAAYLKNRTKYRAVLADVRESAVHRGNLERMLQGGFLTEMINMGKFERSVGEKLVGYFLMEEEVGRIRRFIRCLAAGHPESYLTEVYVPLPSNRLADLDRLAMADSYDAMLGCIKNKALRNALAQYVPSNGGRIDVTSIEAMLDKFLYKRESAMVDKYNGVTHTILRDLIDTDAELRNLRRIVRGKKYYGTDKEQLRSRTIDAHSYLRSSQFEKILSADSTGEIINLLKKSGYDHILGEVGFSDIDDFAKRVMYRKYRKNIRMSTSPTVTVFCYVGLTGIEIDNITTIIEGVRYNVPSDTIMKLLVMGKEVQ